MAYKSDLISVKADSESFVGEICHPQPLLPLRGLPHVELTMLQPPAGCGCAQQRSHGHLNLETVLSVLLLEI